MDSLHKPGLCIGLIAIIVFGSACSESPVDVADADPITKVRILDRQTRLLGIGASMLLKAQVVRGPRVADDEVVTWSTSDEAVATVDDGLVVSTGYGDVRITARAEFESSSVDIVVLGGGDFTYASGDVTLSGRLVLPDVGGPFPAVVTVHGSERARKETYQVPSLVAGGFAVLSYDKRGVGASTGVYPAVGTGNSKELFALLAGDALAGVEFLKGHADIDPDRIGLVGWSQAGWIVPLAASRSDDIKFMVNVVGPTVTVGQEIFFSNLTGEAAGPLPGGRTYEEIETLTEEYGGPHGFDPMPILRRVNTSGLWVLGGEDRSIPTNLTIQRIEKLVTEFGKAFEVHYYANGNHGMVDVTTGQRLPYITREGGVRDWILERVR